MDPNAVLVLHAAATWFMAGLVWFVQLVHYPLMGRVGSGEFPLYEALHQQRTTWIVAPAMTLEAALAAWLAWRPPAAAPSGSVLAAAALLAAIWVSTFAVQVPLHARLSAGFDAAAHRRLVRTNWWRTLGWSVRACLAAWWLMRG
ncbi:MAG: hypothetical protein NZR01_02720 [Bryobacteraceae bacterium]|nr:hypothetical protein [Bryobacteraceae bacterium]